MRKSFYLRNERDVITALASLSLDDEAQSVFSELATNIVRHAGEGEMIVSFDDDEIRMQAINEGHLDPCALIDGYTTQKSLGIGLGMAGRSADEFYYRLSPIEFVWIKFTKKPKPLPYNISYATEALSIAGNGDKVVVVEKPSWTFVALIDGAGHGIKAEEIAKRAAIFVEKHCFMELEHLMLCLYNNFKNSDRGFVIGMLKIYRNRLEFTGVGDVSCKIFRKYGESERLPTKGGILGSYIEFSDFKPTSTNLNVGDIIILYSDGISDKVKPDAPVEELLKKYGREDDRTVVMIR